MGMLPCVAFSSSIALVPDSYSVRHFLICAPGSLSVPASWYESR